MSPTRPAGGGGTSPVASPPSPCCRRPAARMYACVALHPGRRGAAGPGQPRRRRRGSCSRSEARTRSIASVSGQVGRQARRHDAPREGSGRVARPCPPTCRRPSRTSGRARAAVGSSVVCVRGHPEDGVAAALSMSSVPGAPPLARPSPRSPHGRGPGRRGHRGRAAAPSSAAPGAVGPRLTGHAQGHDHGPPARHRASATYHPAYRRAIRFESNSSGRQRHATRPSINTPQCRCRANAGA